MHPFQRSFTARTLTAASAGALLAGGLIVPLGWNPAIAIPAVLLATILLGFVALVTGIKEHAEAMVLLVALVPIAFFIYTCGLVLIVQRLPHYHWVLLAAAAFPTVGFAATFGHAKPAAPPAHSTPHAVGI
jgi:hypothetical protein